MLGQRTSLGRSAQAIAPPSTSAMPLPGAPSPATGQPLTMGLTGFSARARARNRPLRRPGYLGTYLRGR